MLMDAVELERIKKSQAAIAKIAVDGKKVGLSYGQLQAQRFEQQQKLEKAIERCKEPAPQPVVAPKRGGGRPQKPIPEGFGDVAKMILSGQLTMNKASFALNVSPPTVKKWMDEFVCSSESC